ncbi:sulfotransferase domain-containing protein [Parasphingopyxis algicola]|uniref:sulfotransferase domain-containing protein n=1 Tax=Parasphingopyxis algicola TaxID=2026624 RepID=UPI0015A1BA50|nr:sulfotransferase domain-containing protein [Parasphingopyxis algicola]QLC25264.1 sulfotransferase domain-containing protein [Parasphingopyxis algicola]
MAEPTQRRAETAEEFGALIGQMFVPEEVARSIAALDPRPTDVVISPYGKCGTTWLQQAFHTLRTGGDMDFDDISAVVPWVETAELLGIDINAEQRAEPRGFKSHLSYDDMPRGARYIVSLRNPKDALVSMHKFMEGWFIEPGTVPIERFVHGWIGDDPQEKGYWRHLLSWWERIDEADTLLFTYEHMIEDPEGHTRRLAEFCDIELDAELLALTLERSSLAYMLDNKAKFADAMMRAASEQRCGLPAGGDSAKVRKGGVGGHKTELQAETAARLDEIWAELVAPRTGFADYAALDAQIRRRAST